MRVLGAMRAAPGGWKARVLAGMRAAPCVWEVRVLGGLGRPGRCGRSEARGLEGGTSEVGAAGVGVVGGSLEVWGYRG